MVKKLSAAVLCCVMLSSCFQEETENIPVINTAETIVETTDASSLTETESIESTAQKSDETVTEAEIVTSSETIVETEQTADPETYEFDRSFVYDSAYSHEYESYLNRPMFVGEPENTGAEVYVMFTDEEWEHYDAFWEEPFKSNNSIVIRHDGVTDVIPALWIERFGEAFKLHSGDYDGDGETEIAAVRYDTGGTMCMINELSVLKKTDGHYKSHVLDYGRHAEIMSDGLEVNIDDENNEIVFRIYDTEFSYDTSELFADGAGGVDLGSYVDNIVIGDEITVAYGVFIKHKENNFPEYCLNLVLDVDFKDGEFVLSDPRFVEVE